jgi:Sec-independent protein translocase protein TatA
MMMIMIIIIIIIIIIMIIIIIIIIPEGKRPLGRARRRWVDNIKMDLQEVGCGVVDWIEQAQNRDRWRALVNVVMNIRVP